MSGCRSAQQSQQCRVHEQKLRKRDSNLLGQVGIRTSSVIVYGCHILLCGTVVEIIVHRYAKQMLAFKTKLCTFNALGRCTRGSSCKFAHNTTELRQITDNYDLASCKFAHSTTELLQQSDDMRHNYDYATHATAQTNYDYVSHVSCPCPVNGGANSMLSMSPMFLCMMGSARGTRRPAQGLSVIVWGGGGAVNNDVKTAEWGSGGSNVKTRGIFGGGWHSEQLGRGQRVGTSGCGKNGLRSLAIAVLTWRFSQLIAATTRRRSAAPKPLSGCTTAPKRMIVEVAPVRLGVEAAPPEDLVRRSTVSRANMKQAFIMAPASMKQVQVLMLFSRVQNLVQGRAEWKLRTKQTPSAICMN